MSKNLNITIIPSRNTYEGKGVKKYSFIKNNTEIKRLLQGAILGYGIDNIENLELNQSDVWKFVYLDDSDALTIDEIRHLINSLQLDSIITKSSEFCYTFK